MNVEPQWWMLAVTTVIGYALGYGSRNRQVRVLEITIRYMIDTIGRLRRDLAQYRRNYPSDPINGDRVLDPTHRR